MSGQPTSTAGVSREYEATWQRNARDTGTELRVVACTTSRIDIEEMSWHTLLSHMLSSSLLAQIYTAHSQPETSQLVWHDYDRFV